MQNSRDNIDMKTSAYVWMYAGAELSWMRSRAEEIDQQCATDDDCYRSERKCREGLIAVCVGGRCTCVHVDAYDIPIITDPPVLSPSAGDENEDVDHASPTPAIPLNY
ncbi:hypothetical protein TIFTF001_007817 [Ficus carica]|uniref:EB domain-containing protein n=1 Tax=Ficus carica TaxID=3494 RepID=A0AA88CXG5_FICCA|nr:hypothetical protein TIFTF001_007817 [Ficus carica]